MKTEILRGFQICISAFLSVSDQMQWSSDIRALKGKKNDLKKIQSKQHS